MSNQFTLQDFASFVSVHLGSPKCKTYDVCRDAFEAMSAHVTRGGRASIHAFGTFEMKARMARKGRNPKTGESIVIPARIVVVFKGAKSLREAANKTKLKKATKK